MCQRSGLQNVLLLVICSLFLLAFVVGIVTVPAQAQQTSVQAVATAHPPAPPTATAVQNQQRAQQGKRLGNATFWSWTTLSLILVGCAVLLATLSGFLAWSRKRPDEYKTLREKAGRQLRRLARADKGLAKVGLGLLLAGALGVSAPLLGVSVSVNQPLLRLAVLVLGVAILAGAVVKGQPPRLGDLAEHELPSAFVPRPTQLAKLRGALVDEKGRRPRRVALVGMGGAGKSVLAEEAARDPAIRKVYPDMAWVSLGQQPPLPERQHLLAKQLGSTEAVINVDDGRHLLRKLLVDRACLLIVDDAWTREDLRAFDVVGEHSALLVTTRDDQVAKAFEMATVEVGELDDDQTLALLAGRAGQDVISLPATARQVAREVGNLALGLTMAGALAHDIAWEDVLSLLQVAKLDAIEVPVSDDYRYETLQKAIQGSIDALESGPRARYLELAVFNGLGPVPVSAVEALWTPVGVIPAEAHRLLARFAHRSLLRRHPDGRVSRHDLQGDVAANLLGASGLAQAHTQLLTGYQARCTDGWPSVVPDGYIFEHLATHLVAAGRHEELQRLLVDFDWLQAKLNATDAITMINDFNYLPGDLYVHSVQNALQLSAHILIQDTTQLAGQLLGRLLSEEAPENQRLLEQAKQWKAVPWLRPLIPSLTAAGGALLRTLTGQTHDVHAVAVTPDGRQVISASADTTLKVWDLARGVERRALLGHTGGVLYSQRSRPADSKV